MPIQVKCQCGRTINVVDELAGRTARCVYCGASNPVPGTPVGGPAPAPAAPPSFPLLPPLIDHLNVARRLYAATPRHMVPALREIIDFAMNHQRHGQDPDGALVELARVVEANPVVAAYVVRSNAALRKPGGEPSPAAVVFSTDPHLAFDVTYLERVGERVIEVGHTRRNPAIAAVQGPFDDAKWDGLMELPPAVGAAPKSWLGVMFIDPGKLPMGHLATPFVAGIACPGLHHFGRAAMLQV